MPEMFMSSFSWWGERSAICPQRWRGNNMNEIWILHQHDEVNLSLSGPSVSWAVSARMAVASSRLTFALQPSTVTLVSASSMTVINFNHCPPSTITLFITALLIKCHHMRMSYSGCAERARFKGGLLNTNQLQPELMGFLNHLRQVRSSLSNVSIPIGCHIATNKNSLLNFLTIFESLWINLSGKLRIFVSAIKAKNILRLPIWHLVDPVEKYKCIITPCDCDDLHLNHSLVASLNPGISLPIRNVNSIVNI